MIFNLFLSVKAPVIINSASHTKSIELRIIFFFKIFICMKKCNHCGEVKELELFSKNNLTKDGRLNICRACFNARAKKYRETWERKPPTEMSGMKLTNTTKKDWCMMYQFLERIGYDLTKNIHTQFCEKHSLTPRKKKPSEKLKTYIPSDCEE